ncbi:HD domain-containing protein [Brevibacillus dissolubilis]|uniref:HD domain-containing protein n=1 Tax=Brevibacillus dissolubilis TaxID=1844116 RepID=UPI0011166C90|nr:HD domain-containing protein [Brevibacillus dissolubilis]
MTYTPNSNSSPNQNQKPSPTPDSSQSPQDRIISQTIEHVRSLFLGEGSGHDWWHIERVWKNALLIAEQEKDVDLFVVQLAALLHDIADYKFHGGDDTKGPQVAREWLESLGVAEETIGHVSGIIANLSFKGAGTEVAALTREGMVVQDADRLDAIGAIGVARTFAYGGHVGQEMYNPTLSPVMHQSFDEYKNARTTTVNHFYEKLLLLKDRMNLPASKRIAGERHAFMERFLEQFYAEWNGKA